MATPIAGTWEVAYPPTILAILPLRFAAVAFDGPAAGHHHGAVGVPVHAGHLGRQILEGDAIAGGQLGGVVDVAAEPQHAVPIPPQYGGALFGGHREAVQILRLVGLERRAVVGMPERHAEHVEVVALARLLGIDAPVNDPKSLKIFQRFADELLEKSRPGDYNQALMELGQTICLPANPKCLLCPLIDQCLARQRGTQHERPVRPLRKRTPHYDVVAGIIWQTAERSATAPFLIAQRPLNGLLGGLWEFPGGKQENDETYPQTLKREIKEELAINIQVQQAGYLTSIKHAYTHFRITLHAYQAVYESGDIQHIGIADHAWVTFADLDHYAFAVTDRKIISALQKLFG